MRTLSLKSKPLTAAQYIAQRQHERNVRHNRRNDMLCGFYCISMQALAVFALCIALGGLIQIALRFASNNI